MNIKRVLYKSMERSTMVDLTPQNRLTLKRNMLLQKQLDVQVRIMTEEYRMTKKDLEKNCKDLGGFLMYLNHTAPGLSAYGQPDTRAMNAKNMIKYKLTGPSEEDKKKAEEFMEQLKRGEKTDKEKNDTSNKSKDDRPPSRASRNEFFNKRIVLDSKRRSFLQKSMMKDAGGKPPPSSGDPRDDLRRAWASPANRAAGFLSNRDTQGEASSKKRPQTSPPDIQRPRTARYGSDAYSEHDENVRKEVLGRFNFIFDPQKIKPEGRLRQHGLAATPIAVPKTAEEIKNSNLQNNPSSTHSPPGYILNRRVAWSAPPKRREAPPQPADPNSNVHPSHPSRQTMSVTPRSGTARLNTQRCSSASTTFNRETREASIVEATDVKQIIDIQMQKRNPQRPKTAPPNYQLMQRNVAAPRQQVAGILAEIQSRTADTRAMLQKSRQLKKMVKSLAPDDDDDSSD